MVVGVQEDLDVGASFVVAGVVAAAHGGVLERAVHPFDLAIGPRVVGLRQPVLDAMFPADAAEDVLHCEDVAVAMGKLDAVVGQDGMDSIGHSRNQRDQEGGRRYPACFGDQLDEGEFAGSVYRYIKIKLSFGRAHFGDVDVEVPNRVGIELLLRLLVTCHFWQSAELMPL